MHRLMRLLEDDLNSDVPLAAIILLPLAVAALAIHFLLGLLVLLAGVSLAFIACRPTGVVRTPPVGHAVRFGQ